MFDSLPAGGQSPAAPVLPRPVLIGAVLWLCLIEPLALALETQSALPRLTAYGAPAWTLVACRSAIVILGVVAGRVLWLGDAGALRGVAAWGLASGLATVATAVTPFFPGNRPPSLKPPIVIAWCAVYLAIAAGAWILARRRR